MNSPRARASPEKLEIPTLARRAGTLHGEWSAQELPRLAAALWQPADTAVWPPVRWSLCGSVRKTQGSAEELWLQVQASAQVRMQCQRCLGPCDQTLEVDRPIRFVATEEEAQRLDEESEDDVLAFGPKLSAQELVEDELILALPLVAMHRGECPQGLDLAPVLQPQELLPARENPFAALAGWGKAPKADAGKS
jgi:uncharacterized protein